MVDKNRTWKSVLFLSDCIPLITSQSVNILWLIFWLLLQICRSVLSLCLIMVRWKYICLMGDEVKVVR